MATEDTDLDTEEFDDLDLNVSDLDPEYEGNEETGSRNPVTKTGASFLTGLKKSIITPSTINKVIDGALPSSYGALQTKGEEVLGIFSDIKDDVRKELKPELLRLKKITKRFLPIGERYLPESIKKRLEKFSTVEEDYSSTGVPSKEQAQTLLMQRTIAEIFEKQEEDNAEKIATDRVEMVYREKQEDLRTKANITVQGATRDLIARLVSYQDNITANYQKQSLELQFRQYFVAKDLFDVSQASYKDILIRLEAVQQNTSLPEIQKIKKSEIWKEGLQTQIFGSRGESAAEFATKYWDKTKANLITKVREKIGLVKSPIEMINDLLESQLDARDLMREMGEESNMAQSAGGIAGNFLLKKLLKPLRKRLLRNALVQRGDRFAQFGLDNADELLQDFANSGSSNPILDKIADFIYEALPKRQEDKLEKRYKSTGLEPVPFDVTTRRSIVEIIPGFLSRIHQAIMAMATGDENYSRLVFDKDSESFISLKEASKQARGKIAGSSLQTSTEYLLNNFYRKFDKDNKLSNKEKKIINKKLMENANEGVTFFNPKSFYDPSYYSESVDQDSLDKIQEVVESNFTFTPSGKLDFSDANLATITKWAKGFVKIIPSYQELLNEYQNFGEADVLRGSGFISKGSGGEKFDKSKVLGSLLKENVDTVDEASIPLARPPVPPTPSTSTINTINVSLDPLKNIIEITNNTLEDIKISIEDCCKNSFERRFSSEAEGFNNAQEILLSMNKNLTEIKEKDFTATTTVDDSDPIKVKTFKADVLDYLEALTAGVWATVEAVGVGGDNININLTENKSISSRLLKGSAGALLKGIGSAFKGYGSALKGTGRLFGATAVGVGRIGKRLGRMDGIKDIYVNGDEEPRLIARKIRKNHYMNLENNEPVRFIKDITGIVVDIDNNNDVVITDEDYERGFYTYTADGKIRKGLTGTWKLTKAVFGGQFSIIKAAYKLFKKTVTGSLKGIRSVYRAIKGIKDVYIPGESEPRLLGVVMQRGGYYSVNSRKPIFSLKDIDGAICDSSGRVLLELEDLNNLYDSKGKKIDIRSLSDKLVTMIGSGASFVASKIWSATKMTSKLAWKMAKFPLKLSWGLAKTGGRGIKEKLSKTTKKLMEKMGYSKYRENEEDMSPEAILAHEEINILRDIYNLLDQRLKKPVKLRRGSWREQQAEAEERRNREEQEEGKKEGKGKKRKGKKEEDSDEEGGLLSALLSLGGAGSLLGLLGTKIAAGATAIGGGISALAGGVAAAGGIGAVVAAGAIPAAIAAGVAVTGYGLYKGYKYLKNRSAPEPIEKLRMLQYGVLEDEKSRLSIIRNFENYLEDNTSEIDGRVNVNKDAKTILSENLELFEVGESDKNKQQQWIIWYRKRFLPIYLQHKNTLSQLGLKEFSDIENVADKFKHRYIKRVTISSITESYKEMYSPFGDGGISVDPVQIENYTNELVEKYGKDLEKETKPSTEKKEETYSEKEEKKDVLLGEKIEKPISTFEKIKMSVVDLFTEKKLKSDNSKIGIIEKYRLLQFGINPDDNFQVQPIRALEKYCLDVYGYDYNGLLKVPSSDILDEVIDFFPIEKSNVGNVNAWIFWYENRFLPIYVRYIKFMELEKISNFKLLENILISSILTTFISAVDVSNNDRRSYDILVTPFGNYKTDISPDLLDQYRNYLLNLGKENSYDLKLNTNAPKTYQDYKKAQSEKFNKYEKAEAYSQNVIKSAKLYKTDYSVSKFESEPEPEGEKNITLSTPILAEPNSKFGYRTDSSGRTKFHKGVDYAAPEGTPIYAAADGEVEKKYHSDSYGNVVFLKHKNGYVTKYAHMSRFNENINVGDQVDSGEEIGYVGNTGRSSGNHLHFELRKGSDIKSPAFDPLKYMTDANLYEKPQDSEKDIGGPTEDIVKAKSNEVMEDYSEVLTRDEEKKLQKKAKNIELQRQMESRYNLEKLSNIDKTLKDSLQIQISMREYLKLINESINSIEIGKTNAIDTETKTRNKTQTLTLREKANEVVTPLVSVRRKNR